MSLLRDLKRMFKEVAAEDNGRYLSELVRSTYRCAITDGLYVDQQGKVHFNPDFVHPHAMACKKLVFEYGLGKATQPIEVDHHHQMEILPNSELLRMLGHTEVTFPDVDDLGERIHRTVALELPPASQNGNGHVREADE